MHLELPLLAIIKRLWGNDVTTKNVCVRLTELAEVSEKFLYS